MAHGFGHALFIPQQVKPAEGSLYVFQNGAWQPVDGSQTYVTLATAQTISGAKTFSAAGIFSSTLQVDGTLNVTNGTEVLGTSGGAGSTLFMRGAAGNSRTLAFQTGTNYRWAFSCNSTAELGSDAGSAFELNAFTDAGGYIDTPILVARVAGGSVTLARPTKITNATASTSTTTGSLVNAGGFGNAGAMFVGGDATFQNPVYFGKTGSGTGGTFRLLNDGGTNQWYVGIPGGAGDKDYIMYDYTSTIERLRVTQSTGQFTWTGPGRFTGLTTVTDTTDSTSIATGSLVVSGGIGVAKRLTLDGATGKTLRIVNGVANAAVATTLGSVGPTGSTAGNPQGWMRVDINGTDRYIPYW